MAYAAGDRCIDSQHRINPLVDPRVASGEAGAGRAGGPAVAGKAAAGVIQAPRGAVTTLGA